MRKDDLKIIILEKLKVDQLHGYELCRKLNLENINVGISRIYRVLNEMLREGLLEVSWDKSRFGPKRKLYRISDKGKRELDKGLFKAIRTVQGSYKEYLLTLPKTKSVFEKIFTLFPHKLNVYRNIAYVTSEYSWMHEMLINHLTSKMPQGKIYFVKPDSLEVNSKLDNLCLLDGSYNEIPLKDLYTDLVLVVNLPKKNFSVKAFEEWHRVLKQSGMLMIITPSIIVDGYHDPLSIGKFIEKLGYESIEKGEHIDKRLILNPLKKFFKTVKETKVVHTTIFIASEPFFKKQ